MWLGKWLTSYWQEIVHNRTVYEKPLELYGMIASFGPNVIVSEGDDWKRSVVIAFLGRVRLRRADTGSQLRRRSAR